MKDDKTTRKLALQAANRAFLRNVVFPHMRKPDTLIELDFFEVYRDCGTYRCVWGWYRHLRHGWHDRPVFIPSPLDLEEEFGPFPLELLYSRAKNPWYLCLFADKADSGDLDTREERLDVILAAIEREQNGA